MIPVPNKKNIWKLSRTQFKGNRQRNVSLIAAVILAGFMLTAVFSLGISYLEAVKERNVKLEGSLYDASVPGPTGKQIAAFKQMPNVKHTGILAGCATITEFDGIAVDTTLAWTDRTGWEQQFKPALAYVEGDYPQKEGELLLSVKALKKMGIDEPQVGMVLPLTYATDQELVQRTFTLSGYYNDYSNRNRGFVSEQFFTKTKAAVTDLDKSRLLLTFHNPLINEADVKKMEAQAGLVSPQVIFADTELLIETRRMLLVLFALILLIIVSSYLLIYNILTISIYKDIRFYGLLRTIGATSRQLRQLVFMQLLKVSAFGIPLGLLAGALLSFGLVPSLLESTSNYELGQSVSFHPLVFLGSGLFTLLTIYISARKPARIAGTFSSIEAARYTNVSNKQVGTSKSKKRLIDMAWQNLFRDKKQAVIVFLSLFIGLTAFLTIFTFLDSNRADRVLDYIMDNDMTLVNKTAANDVKKQKFTPELMNRIKKTTGVKKVYELTATEVVVPKQDEVFHAYVKQMYDSGMMFESYEQGLKRMAEKPEEFISVASGIDEAYFDELAASGNLTVNKNDFLAGKTAVLRTTWKTAEALADVSGSDFEVVNGERTQRFQIAAIDASNALPSASYSGFYPEMLISEQAVAKLTDDPLIDSIEIIYDESYDRQLEKQLLALISDDKEIDVESKIARYDAMQESEKQLTVFGVILAGMLALLGIMNYVNVMTTSIMTRQHEFAILQSIGMTGKQLNKMVMLEGAGYGILSLLFVSTGGVAITYGLFQLNNSDAMPFVIPLLPVAGVFALVLLLCLLVPRVMLRFIGKNSLIDLLSREAGV